MDLSDRHGALLRRLFDAALDAAAPARVVPPHLPPAPRGRTIVVGAGKAAAAMARAVEDHWPGELAGLVVTRYGHAVPCRRIEIVEAAHPVPDEAGAAAARRMLASVAGLAPDDLVLCLISGGASALLALPAPGITLEDKRRGDARAPPLGRDHRRDQLRAKTSLGDQGRPPRRGSRARRDRHARDLRRAGRRPGGDRLGPDRRRSLDFRRRARDPRQIRDRSAARHRRAASRPTRDETPKPGDPRLALSRYVLVATPERALEAAADAARALGLTPVLLSDRIEGEAREVAKVHAAHRAPGGGGTALRRSGAGALPAIILSGGETSVTVRGKGRGGRNAEFMLALALALDGAPRIHAIACDSDGIDGTEDNAGALAHPDTLARAERLGLDLKAHLADNDAYGAFKALGDLVVTGPTLTNVNDFRAILVEAA